MADQNLARNDKSHLAQFINVLYASIEYHCQYSKIKILYPNRISITNPLAAVIDCMRPKGWNNLCPTPKPHQAQFLKAKILS